MKHCRRTPMVRAILTACSLVAIMLASPGAEAAPVRKQVTAAGDILVRLPGVTEGKIGGFPGITTVGESNAWIRGKALGFPRGARASLQVATAKGWARVSTVKVRKNKRYALRVPTTRVGAARYRVVVSRTASRVIPVTVVPVAPVWPTIELVKRECVKTGTKWRWVLTYKATGGIYVDSAGNAGPESHLGVITWVPVVSPRVTRTWSIYAGFPVAYGEEDFVGGSFIPLIESYRGAADLRFSAEYRRELSYEFTATCGA